MRLLFRKKRENGRNYKMRECVRPEKKSNFVFFPAYIHTFFYLLIFMFSSLLFPLPFLRLRARPLVVRRICFPLKSDVGVRFTIPPLLYREILRYRERTHQRLDIGLFHTLAPPILSLATRHKRATSRMGY